MSDANDLPTRVPALALPPLLLFPHTHASLRLPRAFYRRLVEYGLTEDGFVGTVVRDPERDSSRLRPLGGLAEVVHVHHAPCGRASLLHLHGLARCRVRAERLDGELGRIEVVPIRERAGPLRPERRSALLDACRHASLVHHLLPGADALLSEPIEDEALVNRICCECALPLADKYFLFEADDIDQRGGRLLDLFRFYLDAIRSNAGTTGLDL